MLIVRYDMLIFAGSLADVKSEVV